MKIPLLILAGPTASGKTELSIELAKVLNAEIVSADSMQVYRGMDLGTAKPELSLREIVPHHLIDICDPWVTYNTCRFVEDASKAIQEIHNRKKTVILVGGTPLYIKRLLEGIFPGPSADWETRQKLEQQPKQELYAQLCKIDPEAARRISQNDMRRMVRALEVFYTVGIPISEYQRQHTKPLAEYDPCFIGIGWKKEVLHQRIELRVKEMIQKGLVEETKRLLSLPYPLSHTASQAIGYKEVIEAIHEKGKFPLLESTIIQNTKKFSKRQMTWLRRFPVQWMEINDVSDFPLLLEKTLERWKIHLNKRMNEVS